MGIDLPWCGISFPITHGGLWGTVLSPHASGFPMDKESGPHRGRLGYASRLCQEQSGSRHARLAGNYHMPQKSRFEKDAITAHAQPHRRHQAMDVLLRISDRRGTAANWQVVFIRTISCGGSVRSRGDLSDRVLLGKRHLLPRHSI